MHLTPNGCSAIRFKIFTCSVYAPLLNRIDALPLNVSYILEAASTYHLDHVDSSFLNPVGQYFLGGHFCFFKRVYFRFDLPITATLK